MTKRRWLHGSCKIHDVSSKTIRSLQFKIIMVRPNQFNNVVNSWHLLASQDTAGSGNVTIDNRKAVAIKNWMEKTSDAVTQLVESTQHDVPFNAGPFGETLSQMNFLFLGSSSPVALSASASSGLTPLEGEATILIDYDLTLTESAQFLLFARICRDFEVSTALVDVRSKKKYRAKEQDLHSIRNLSALWSQVRSLCERHVDVDDFESQFMKSNHVDEELSEVLVQRPKCFGVSMLPSYNRKMQSQNEEKQAQVHQQVEQQRLEVRSARFDFFKKALQQDQLQLATVQQAPFKLQALQRRAEAVWREQQAVAGENAVNNWTNKFMRITQVDKIDFIVGPVNEFITFVAPGIHFLTVSIFHASIGGNDRL